MAMQLGLEKGVRRISLMRVWKRVLVCSWNGKEGCIFGVSGREVVLCWGLWEEEAFTN